MGDSANLRSGKIVNNDPWAILIALASLIIVATAIAIVVICILWNRYQKSRVLFERSLIGIPFEIAHTDARDVRLKEYEVQSLDMYVPQEDRDDLGEVHIGFSPKEGIKSVHHVKEMQIMQNQLPDPIQRNAHSFECLIGRCWSTN